MRGCDYCCGIVTERKNQPRTSDVRTDLGEDLSTTTTYMLAT
jgi:hypothetical protein